MLNSVHLSGVDLNLLVLFDVVLREKNVGRAASALHLSPSAVSHGLSRLRRLFEDPLFLRTPKGVVPTDRAGELAEPIAEILARVSRVVESATPFDAAKSTRRFTLGMADATAAVLVPRLIAQIQRAAPSIDISLRHIFPISALEDLETRAIDLALAAIDQVPARFAAQVAHEEDFVIAGRVGHPFLAQPTVKSYADAGHVLASLRGDSHGFVDDALAEKGLRRRIALVVPNFMLALAAIAETNLLSAVPRSLAQAHATRFGVAYVDAPFPLRRYELRVAALQSALLDAGIVWLFDAVMQAARNTHGTGPQKRARRSIRRET